MNAERREPAAIPRTSQHFLWIPAVTVVTAFLIFPLLMMFRMSLNKFVPGEFMVEALTFENYVNVLSDGYYRGVLFTTVWVAALSAFLCLIMALPAAYYVARIRPGAMKSIILILIILPLLMGSAVRTAGWMVVLSDSGALNKVLLGLGLRDAPLQLMYTPQAVVIALVSVLLPFMLITLQSAMENIHPSLEEASLSLGAPPVKTFFRVIIPLSTVGIVAGTLLCFILALNAYATPFLLGGPRFQMMAPALYQQITMVNNWPAGATLAFILLSVSLLLTLSMAYVVKKKVIR